jgi:carboxyl-terminal processing protease
VSLLRQSSLAGLPLSQDVFNIVDRNCRKFAAVAAVGLSTLAGSYPAHSATYPVFEEAWNIVNDNFYDSSYNKQDWKAERRKYETRLAQGADEEKLTRQMLASLGDKYTHVLNRQSFADLWKFDAIGVGLLFQSDGTKGLHVSAPPLPGSAAFLAGMQEGDVIDAVDGILTKDMPAMKLLEIMSTNRNPVTQVQFTSAATGQTRTVSLQRSFAKASDPVFYATQHLEDGSLAGYIRLKEFNAEAVGGMRDALQALGAAGITELVLDLRGNTGGGFQFALNIGGMFMQEKTMVTAEGRESTEKFTFSTSYPEGVLYTKPLVLLTDGLSASASEVLVAGLRDNCRAAVVGSQTFGKGKIQALFGLSNGEGVVMTVAEYRSPLGRAIQSAGITPDVKLPLLNAYVDKLLGLVWARVPRLRSLQVDRAIGLMQAQCAASPVTPSAAVSAMTTNVVVVPTP